MSFANYFDYKGFFSSLFVEKCDMSKVECPKEICEPTLVHSLPGECEKQFVLFSLKM